MKQYLVPSDRTTESYTVTIDSAGNKCTCMAFQTRPGPCKHIQRVLLRGAATFEMAQSAVPARTARPLPMLAKPLTDKVKIVPGRFAVEEKFDGHRMVVRVQRGIVTAWSRTGKDCIQKMHPKMVHTLMQFPDCVLDGELINRQDQHSYGVSHLQASKLTFVVFDVLEIGATNAALCKYDQRREALITLFSAYDATPQVELAQSRPVENRKELDEVAEEIWARHGEGVIVKMRDAAYHPGKRADAFMKLKDVRIATVTILGFCESGGEIVNRGHYGTTVVQDDEGNSTVVKTLDDETLARLEKAAPISRIVQPFRLSNGRKLDMTTNHPWVGKRLLIEYHERTPDGSYRHPRWDRLEEE